jgi:large subunit ribosomal protein L25
MKTINVKVSERKDLGKKASKKLRKSSNIPCVLYGGEKLLHFYAHENDFRHLVYTPNVFVVEFDMEGTVVTAILKDIQFHPVTDKIIHIDFLEVSDDKAFVLSVPVRLEGFAKGVQEGGKLALEARRLRVKGLKKDFIEEIVLDVTELTLGKSIKVNDIQLNNLEIVEPAFRSVASVKVTRQAKDAEAETAEGAEGAEAAATEEKAAE